MTRAKNGLEFDNYDSFSIIRISTDDEDRALHEDHVDEVGTRAFAAAHPEFYQCGENAAALAERLADYGDGEKLPCTRRNLELVYAELLTEGKIKSAPPAAAPEIDQSRGIVQVRTDALLEYQTPPTEAAALEKLRDDPALSDHQRKQRLRRLAALAGEQRRENSTLARRHGQPPVL